MRLLVTAGPTREHWDDVRYLSSASTGRMGIEVARAAVRAGHCAVLVLGPTHLEPPPHPCLEVVRVVSAREMLAACEAAWPGADALVATAAVADYRPAERHRGKRPKTPGEVALTLAANPDVVATLAATKGDRPVVGFALQAGDDDETRAREKMARKGLDAVVLDGPAALGADQADFALLLPDGTRRDLHATTKARVADLLVELLAGP